MTFPPLGRLGLLACWALASPALGGDWPAWRYDARRSAASPDDLPATLGRQWTLTLPPLTPAWPDQPFLPFDAAYEPVVVGRLMYVGSSRTDSVTAYDTRTGAVRWRFLADGPVRFAPLVHAGKLYVVSDDGHLYCLKADTGSVVWKFRGGPADRRVLGNGRLISTWPARGAPVIAEGTVYFAASIWPFMGIFIHALDADTGRVIWTNDGDGSMYIKQPHGADSFAGVAPQGPMSIAGDLLLVPGGRSVPAAYDRATGRQRHFLLNDNSKKGGGHTVAVAGDVFFNGPGVFATATGKYLGTGSPHAVTGRATAYVYQSGEVRTLDLTQAEIKPPRWKVPTTGAVEIPGVTTMIRAGGRLFVGSKGRVAALALPLPEDAPDEAPFAWEAPIEGTPVSLVAADDRLFVSTQEGRILCFGPAEPVAEPARSEQTPPPDSASETPEFTARAVIAATGVTEGYAVVWSADVPFLTDLVRRSRLHVIAVDPDADRVRAAREALIAADLYGERCAVHVGSPGSFPLPPYLASLMVAPDLSADELPALYESLRPYGGTLFLPTSDPPPESLRPAVRHLPGGKFDTVEGGVRITRAGPLPGSADWTHEHADAANTRVSRDTVVKAPLGVLWFGGTSNEGILPRHGHGPQPQVVGGRIIIEGPDLLRATDAYTGRLLWETRLPGLGDFYNSTAHQPGANARGTNYISLPDGIYVAYRQSCLRLDPATGQQIAAFPFPVTAEDGKPLNWGHLNVVGEYLVGAADPQFTAELEKQARSPGRLFRLRDADVFAASRHLAVLNRHTGKPLWTARANTGFRHNTICAGNGRLFAIDRASGLRPPKPAEAEPAPPPARVVAWDLATGRELWQDESETFGTWLSFSEKFDVLVEAGRVARDTLTDEPKGMRAYRGSDGTELWFNKTYVGPAMLHGDTILRGQGASDLLTGEPKMRRNPVSGELEEWAWSRNYGCNTPAASEHLLTFRSGAAGYFDLCNDGGTGNLGGFRSSCTNNLIVANGILAAPDYTRSCTCSYQNQCSIALVPTASAEEWTFYGKSKVALPVRRVGINFGAPGDRPARNGTLWLEHPSSGGPSPTVPVTVSGPKVEYFARHQSGVTGPLPWVGSSGVRGAESVTVRLRPDRDDGRDYTVRLYFAEPDELQVGDRVFGVTVQGRRLLEDFDVVQAAGGPRRTVVKEFRGVRVYDELRLSFHPRGPQPALLCGVEVVAE